MPKLGSQVILHWTVSFNPDFGQVEADPSVLNLSVYETFYEEKRPFFIEGGELLRSRSEIGSLFYSRRIGNATKYSPELKEDEYTKVPDETTIINSANGETGEFTNPDFKFQEFRSNLVFR